MIKFALIVTSLALISSPALAASESTTSEPVGAAKPCEGIGSDQKFEALMSAMLYENPQHELPAEAVGNIRAQRQAALDEFGKSQGGMAGDGFGTHFVYVMEHFENGSISGVFKCPGDGTLVLVKGSYAGGNTSGNL